MAATVVTITIPEAIAPKVIKALCVRGKVPESGANAKAVLIEHVLQLVVQEERQLFNPAPLEGIT